MSVQVIDRRIRELRVETIMLPIATAYEDIIKYNPRYYYQVAFVVPVICCISELLRILYLYVDNKASVKL